MNQGLQNAEYLLNRFVKAIFPKRYIFHIPHRHHFLELRPKRLLMHKKEIMKLMGEVKQQGCALIPLSVYFNERGRAKMLIGLCKGKKNYDKRETEAKRDAQRNIERSLAERNRY